MGIRRLVLVRAELRGKDSNEPGNIAFGVVEVGRDAESAFPQADEDFFLAQLFVQLAGLFELARLNTNIGATAFRFGRAG